MDLVIKKFQMKFYEKRLLDNLQSDETQNVPLKNVRNAMGHIGQTVGNPLTKTEIVLTITTAFFDNMGNLVLPAALPLNLQTYLPIYLFGLTDFNGAYLRMNTILPPSAGWLQAALVGIVNPMGIWGRDVFAPLPGLNPVAGDMIMLFIDALAPNFLAWTCVHCNNVAYGTFLNSFVSDLITISHIRYFSPNINQFINPVVFGYQTLFGKTSWDTLDPRMYILGKDPQQNICDLPVNLTIDKNLMIGFQLIVFCQNVNWVLFVEKVEPLTHKLRRK